MKYWSAFFIVHIRIQAKIQPKYPATVHHISYNKSCNFSSKTVAGLQDQENILNGLF